MLTLTANNGNVLADIMHKNGQIKDGLTVDQCYNIAKESGVAHTDQHFRWLSNDDFWEDFCSTIEDLGYKLKY